MPTHEALTDDVGGEELSGWTGGRFQRLSEEAGKRMQGPRVSVWVVSIGAERL
jgi:hypothetical protein